MEHAKKSICSAVYKLFATFGRISKPTSPKDTWRKNLAQYYLCNSWWFSSELVRCEAFLFLADFAKGRAKKRALVQSHKSSTLERAWLLWEATSVTTNSLGPTTEGNLCSGSARPLSVTGLNTRLTLHLIGFSKGFANTVPLQPVWELVFNLHLNTNEEQPIFSPWKDHLIYK